MPSTRSLLPRVREIGAPMSSVSSCDSSSKFFSTRSASLSSMFCRSNGLTLLHGPSKARRAAATARVDVLGVALGDGGEQFAGRWIVSLELLARGGIDPFAVDQHLLVGAIRIRMARDRNCLRDSHVCSPLCYYVRRLRDCYLRSFTAWAW